jgi:hypothetical protein
MNSQNTIVIEILNQDENLNTPIDSNWTIQELSCHLSTSSCWIEPVTGSLNLNYFMFSGKFSVNFENFNFKVDSLIFETKDACNICFSAITYDNINGNFDMTGFPGYDNGEDTLKYINTFSTNPDSLVLDTWEGGFRKLTVFYSSEITNVFDYNSTNDNFQFCENKLIFSNGFSDSFIDLKVMDMSGKVVYQNMKFTGTHLDLGSLNSGIYLVSAIDKKQQQKHVSKKVRISH